MPNDTLAAPHFARGAAGYETARRESCWNATLPGRFPDLIVLARDEAEVVQAIRLARARGWKVAVRSGGHSWACNHLRDGGMLLDVSRLDAVEVDATAMRATAGPGVKGHELNDRLARRKLFFPVGHCQGVRLGGYLLQGGFGWNSRMLGNACANVVGLDYVDAAGEARHASADENPEMFWAARGAGPGFFAVVTRYHLKLAPRPKVIGAKLAFYGADQLEAVYRWAHAVGPTVPASIELMLILSRGKRGPEITVMAPVFADSLGQAWKDLAFMNTRPPGARRATPFIPMSVARMTEGVMGHYPAQASYAVDNMWTGAAFDDLLPGLRRITETLPAAPSHMLWMNWAPPAGRPDMAYSLDDQVYIALYGVWRRPEDEAGAARWAVDNMTAMAPQASGVQLADENLGQRPARFVADANLARLDALRARHDPDGRFHPYMGRP